MQNKLIETGILFKMSETMIITICIIAQLTILDRNLDSQRIIFCAIEPTEQNRRFI